MDLSSENPIQFTVSIYIEYLPSDVIKLKSEYQFRDTYSIWKANISWVIIMEYK